MLRVVYDPLKTGVAGAMGTAVNRSIPLHSVSQYATFAMIAYRRKDVDGALKGVEAVSFAFDRQVKTLVVFVPAVVAFFHGWEQISDVEVVGNRPGQAHLGRDSPDQDYGAGQAIPREPLPESSVGRVGGR